MPKLEMYKVKMRMTRNKELSLVIEAKDVKDAASLGKIEFKKKFKDTPYEVLVERIWK